MWSRRIPVPLDKNNDDVEDSIRSMRRYDILGIMRDIQKKAFTAAAWNGEGHEDTEFRTMCRFLQEVENFKILRYAVKYGDVCSLGHHSIIMGERC